MIRAPALVALLLAALLASGGCNDPAAVRTAEGLAMGTTWSVQVVEPPAGLTRARLRRTVQDALDDVDERMSTYREDSEVSRFNRQHHTDWIPVSRELLDVLRTALEVAALTEGAFDPTVGPLVDLWGFGPVQRSAPPDEATLEAARARVGYDKLELRLAPPALRKRIPDLRLDLSSIAKGWAVDRVARALDTLGATHYLVEVGGELRGRGHNARGEPWRIAIERPVPGARLPYAVFPLWETASATSGDYRNFRQAHGKRLSHLIDPRSGRPVAQRLASVTVLDPSGARADALATGLLVLGPDRGFELAVRQGIAAYFIERTPQGFRHRASPAFPSPQAVNRGAGPSDA